MSVLTKEDVIRILRENYPYMISEYGVKRIGLFGSYARNRPTETRDVDLVVEFDRPIGFRFVEFTEYLERLLETQVNVLTPAGIQGIRIEHIAKSIEENTVYV